MSKLITFKTAVLAKQKGYDIPCANGYYETLEHTVDCGRGGVITFPYQPPRTLTQPAYGFRGENIFIAQAPTQSEIQTWFRDVHNIHIEINVNISREWYFTGYDLSEKRCAEIVELYEAGKDFKGYSFEQALEIALEEALKLLP